MKMSASRAVARLTTAVAALGSLLAATQAHAAFVSTGTGSTIQYADEYVATNTSTAASPVYSSNTTNANVNNYLLATPGQYTFSNLSFNAQQTGVIATDSIGSYSFQDSYVFQVSTAANGDTATASLYLPPSFGMSNLQVRMYQIANGTTTPVVLGSLLANGAVSVVSGWQGVAGVDTTQITVPFSGLQAGDTYVMDIAGTASGTGGGGYYGALNLQPVPIPAAIWLLVSGVGGLGALSRRRDAASA